jgi:hypothetical protein
MRTGMSAPDRTQHATDQEAARPLALTPGAGCRFREGGTCPGGRGIPGRSRLPPGAGSHPTTTTDYHPRTSPLSQGSPPCTIRAPQGVCGLHGPLTPPPGNAGGRVVSWGCLIGVSFGVSCCGLATAGREGYQGARPRGRFGGIAFLGPRCSLGGSLGRRACLESCQSLASIRFRMAVPKPSESEASRAGTFPPRCSPI